MKRAPSFWVSILMNVSYGHHLNQINSKISRALFAIKQTKQALPYNCLRTLYYCMIHPHLQYGILAWGNATQSNLNRTIKLQKRAIRIINRASYNAHTEPLFKRSNVLKLTDLHEYEAIQFMFKYHSNQLPKSFDNMFQFNYNIETNRLTRQSYLMHIECCESFFSSRFPHYNFPKIWNNTAINPDNISINQIRKKIRVKMINSYSDRVKCQNQLCKECYN